MAKVPYQPWSAERPIPFSGATGFRVQADADAFGGQVGQAVSHLGTTLEGAGQEVFDRALALKDLDNRNDATMAASDFADDAADGLQRMKSLEGQQAVHANETFRNELEAKRLERRNKLSSPMAQRLYDSETRGVHNRTVFSAAEWAGQQQRKYTDDADKAEVLSEQKQAGVNPQDDAAMKIHLDNIEKKVRAQMQGDVDELGIPKWSDAATNYKIMEAQSLARRNRLVELSRIDPPGAMAKFKTEQQYMTQDDRIATRRTVEDNGRTIGSRVTVADVMAGRNLQLGNRPVTIEKARFAIGGFESGNNYQNVGVQTRHGQALGRYQVMEQFLPDFLRQAGMPSMTRDEFLHNPAAQDQLFEKVFGGYMTQYGTFNEAASRWFTGRSIADARAAGAYDAHGTTVDRYLSNTNAWLAKVAPLRDVMDVSEQTMNQLIKPEDDPLAADYVRAEAQKQYNHVHAIVREKDNDNARLLLGELSKPDQNGKYPTTMEELEARPNGAATRAAYTEMNDAQKAGVRAHFDANTKKGYELTPEKQRRFDQLKGMLMTPEGRRQLVDMDLTNEHLPNPMYQVLVNDQNSLKTHAEIDPRISLIVNDGTVQSKLQDLGLTRAQNAQSHDEFMGVFQRMLNAAQTDAKVPLTRKEMLEVFNDAVEQQVEKGWLWGANPNIPSWLPGGPGLGDPYYKQAPMSDNDVKIFNYISDDPKFQYLSDTEKMQLFKELQYKALLQRRRATRAGTAER